MGILSFAADNVLNFPVLSSFKHQFAPEVIIDWRMLIPGNTSKSAETNERAGASLDPDSEQGISDAAPMAAPDTVSEVPPTGDLTR